MKDNNYILTFIRNIEIGTKVFLDNEYGVLTNLKKHEHSTIIRWDTPDERDFEDWCGLWESFVKAGGEITDQNYQFKYINDDGSLKK
ncbi:hypothetical protein EGI16_13780 [Chryseobacterium sp. G0240]|uniref:hypothetical protein n=1 Tax=Chryseobacterium sp. G0240 TaxID=2487066 RepID=UPI000F44A874|nr:hypothetical protein [Chryseobacterium sp. G0240]ROI02687.1 hypothetical protein EGI16_13780 [Chryseobacterium sp. G0240]